MESAVLFLIFNRPDTSAIVFDAIRKAKPKRLYVAADGPREGNERDKTNCAQTRAVVQVDWDCEVKLLFREENLGCKQAVSQGITWFFQQEEQGIILEDDCLPHPSFFPYCDALLEHYKHEERVMLISGDNFQHGKVHGEASYYFSQYSHIWGWASWRRAWDHYDVEIKSFPEFVKKDKISTIFKDAGAQKYWLRKMERTYEQGMSTWDYQWTYTIWNQGGVTVLPNVNLISNIGFETGGAHTNIMDKDMANLPSIEMKFPLIHPNQIAINEAADDYTYRKLFKKTWRKKLMLLPYVKWSDLLHKR